MANASMTPERWRRASGVFLAALERSSHERTSWVREQCATDAALADIVLAMIDRDRVRESRVPVASSGLLEAALDDCWPEGHRIGPFSIVRRIGVGGMGEVYLAERVDGIVRQQVAVKRLHSSHAHPELRRRFMLERRILARLDHPLIARFLDAGSDAQGRPWAAMEYVEGEPLDQYVRSRRLDLSSRLRLFLAIADTVAYAHRQLIVHRDIKPGNVLVDASGRPRLLDFGIAKVLSGGEDSDSQESTRVDLRAFSLHHAAPEQLRGQASGVSCDIYALGVLLYELLTGKRPLQLDGLAYGEAERAVLEQPPPAPSRRLARRADWPVRPGELRGDLDQIVLHALEKLPEHRYPTVDALRADVEAVLEHQPISLRRSQRVYRLLRFVGRQRVPVGLAALLGAGIIAGASAFVLKSHEVQRERDQAQAALQLLRDAFAAANPLNTQGAQITARQILDTSRLELGARIAESPQQYLDLVLTLADVELAIGRPTEAAELLDSLPVPGSNRRGEREQRLALLRARVALANNDHQAFGQLRGFADRQGQATAHAWRLLDARRLANMGERSAASDILEALVAALPLQADSEPLAFEVRQFLAQTYRSAGRNELALSLLDRTLRELRSVLPHGHPRILVTRLHRLDTLRSSGRADEALAEAETLLPEIEQAFGAVSTMAAATQMSLASILNTLGQSQAAAAKWPQVIETWIRATGPEHPNTQRARFNFANLLERLGDLQGAEDQLQELVRLDMQPDVPGRHRAMSWALHLAELQLRRDRPQAALHTTEVIFARTRPEHSDAWMRERYLSLLNTLGQRLACARPAADPADGCAALSSMARRMHAEDSEPPPIDNSD